MKQNSYNSLAMSLDKKSTFLYTDEQLIGRFQAGDERAYVELVNRYKDRLFNFIFPFFGDVEQSEDVVQDTNNLVLHLCAACLHDKHLLQQTDVVRSDQKRFDI